MRVAQFRAFRKQFGRENEPTDEQLRDVLRSAPSAPLSREARGNFTLQSGKGAYSRSDLMGDEAALDRRGFDRLLEFLEGAHLDLAHALARDAVLLRQVLERRRVFPQAPLGQDVTLAVVEMRHRL